MPRHHRWWIHWNKGSIVLTGGQQANRVLRFASKMRARRVRDWGDIRPVEGFAFAFPSPAQISSLYSALVFTPESKRALSPCPGVLSPSAIRAWLAIGLGVRRFHRAPLKKAKTCRQTYVGRGIQTLSARTVGIWRDNSLDEGICHLPFSGLLRGSPTFLSASSCLR